MDELIGLKSSSRKTKPVKSRLTEVSRDAKLVERCLVVVVANLESYPAEAMGMLTEDDWNSVIRMRHERTAPKKGKGGLDGKGRINPAISRQFLLSVEKENPHLAESAVADELIWKDYVEYSFPSGNASLGRPRELMYPWPILVNRIKRAGADLSRLLTSPEVTRKEKEEFDQHVGTLCDAPMNVSLLDQTGIGKTLKRIIKTAKTKRNTTMEQLGLYTERQLKPVTMADRNGQTKIPLTQLEDVLQKWKRIASDENEASTKASDKAKGQGQRDGQQSRQHLAIAENCQSWRTLFISLQDFDSFRKASHSAKLRSSRDKLAKNAPKIVKVRPAKAKHERILNHSQLKNTPKSYWQSSASKPNKMKMLRAETKVATSLAKGKPKQTGFGSAVACASSGKVLNPKTQRPATKTSLVRLTNGGRMAVPKELPASAKPSELRRKLSKKRR